MTTPTRVLSKQERTVLAAYALGAEVTAIAAKFDIGHGRVSQIVVDLAGVNRNLARILVENHDGTALAPGRAATTRVPAIAARPATSMPTAAKIKRAPKKTTKAASSPALSDLSDDDRAILTAYVHGKDLAVIADEFGLTQSKIRLALLRLCGFEIDVANRLLHPAADLGVPAFLEPAPIDLEPAAIVATTVEDVPLAPTLVDDAPEAVPVDLAATDCRTPEPQEPTVEAVGSNLIAAYIAHRCDPCHYTGPAGHHHPTRRVRVHILELGSAA